MCNATHHKSYGLGWTAFNEFRKLFVYILYDINIYSFIKRITYNVLWVFIWQDKGRNWDIKTGYEKRGYGRPSIKYCRHSCKNPGYEKKQDK